MKYVLVNTLVIGLLGLSGYIFLEPVDLLAVEDQIVIHQVVSGEVAITSPPDITMLPELYGQTGGDSYGYAVWTITSNNTTGFTASLTASTSPNPTSDVMKGDRNGDYIHNYTPVVYNTPEAWSVPAADAEFGYTATTTTIGDLVAAFHDSSGTCGSGGTQGNCFINASSTSRQLINRGTSAPSGTQLGMTFKVTIGASHSPAVLADTYTATTTITANNKTAPKATQTLTFCCLDSAITTTIRAQA